jgi:hypothetical protein
MWSRQFVAVGLSSATVLAALSGVAIWLLFYLVLTPAVGVDHPEARVIFEGVFCVAVGVPVYPACWFFMVQRSRDYSSKRTLELICVTYGISCLIVGVVFCLAMVGVFGAIEFVGLFKMIFGSIEANWSALGYGALVLVAIPLVALFGMIIGAFIILPAFVALATPVAYIHRWLLLKMFAANGTNTQQFQRR